MKQLIALTLIGFLTQTSFAADLSLSGGSRVSSENRTTKAEVLPNGAGMVGVAVSSKDLGASKKVVDDSTEKKSLQTASAFVGYGIANTLQLSVLASGTKDISETSRNTQEEKSSMKFSSAKAAVAVQLLDHAGFAATIEPFAKVGGGSANDISFSRSSKTNGGTNILLGYGAKGTGSLDLALNYLSLGGEKVNISGEELTLLDEKSGDLGLSIRFADAVGMTAGIRHSFLHVKSEEKTTHLSDRRAYASLNFFPGQAEIALYGAIGIDKESSNQKTQEMGLRIAYVIGKSESAPKPSFAESKAKTETPESLKNWEPKTGANPNPDYVIPGIDPNARDIGGSEFIKADMQQNDDFRAVEASIKEREALRAKGPSDDELVENELSQLRDTEKRVQAEKAKREAAEEQAHQQDLRDQAGKNSKKRAEMERNANERVKRIKGITDEELNWRGLE